MQKLGTILFLWFISVIGFFLFLVRRTYKLMIQYKDSSLNLGSPSFGIDLDSALNRLAKAIQFKTVSYDPSKYERQELAHFVEYITTNYKNVHSCPWIKWEIINEYSLFYHVKSSMEEKHGGILPNNFDYAPWMVIAHSDVVPVSEGDSQLWTAPAFSGNIIEANGKKYLCGRGSLDAKHILCANLECLEKMIADGVRPRDRSIFLGFGHDEEVGGYDGATHISRRLTAYLRELTLPSKSISGIGKDQISGHNNSEKSYANTDYVHDSMSNVSPPLAFILDEGTNVFTDILHGKNLALIGISEKVACTLKLTVKTSSGHSSMPKPGTNAIAILSRAVDKLQAFSFSRPTSIQARTIEREFLRQISPHLFGPDGNHLTRYERAKTFLSKALFANSDLYTPFFISLISRSPLINSLFTTVSCVTKFSGGIKENVVPSEAQATFLQRIHPAQSISEVMEINRRVINDPMVQLESHAVVPSIPLSSFDENPSSENGKNGYLFLKKTILQLFPETVVAPIVMPGGTDSKHFVGLARNIYRFSPVQMSTADLRGVHGVDEKIAVESYEKFLNWYYQLYTNVSGLESIN